MKIETSRPAFNRLDAVAGGDWRFVKPEHDPVKQVASLCRDAIQELWDAVNAGQTPASERPGK